MHIVHYACLPYNWNIDNQKKKFVSELALTELIIKRHLPTPISLHVLRHLRLWHSLSALFDIFYPTVCLPSSIIPLSVVSGKPTLNTSRRRVFPQLFRLSNFLESLYNSIETRRFSISFTKQRDEKKVNNWIVNFDNHKNYNFLDCDWFKNTPIFH